MARQEEITIHLVDDLTGRPADETVKFAIDGRHYVIDLTKANAAKFRRVMKPYVDAGRTDRVASARRRRGPSSSETYKREEVRAWARAKGLNVAPRGRISNDIVDQWKRATKKRDPVRCSRSNCMTELRSH